jgi:hypothetical protein
MGSLSENILLTAIDYQTAAETKQETAVEWTA